MKQANNKQIILRLLLVVLFYFLFVYGAGRLLRFVLSYLSNAGIPMLLNGRPYYPLAGVLILIVYKLISRSRWKEVGIQKIKKQDWRYALYAFAGLFVVAFVSRIIAPGFDLWYARLSNLAGLSAFIGLAVIMPFQVIHEEIFQRSLIQSNCSKALSPLLAGITVSLSFAIAHFFWVPGSEYHIAVNLIFVFLGSMLLFALFEKTQNLAVAVLVHLAYNLVVLFQIYFHISGLWVQEMVLFGAWGVLFLLTARRLQAMLKKVFTHIKFPSLISWIFIAVAGIMFPIAIHLAFLKF